MARSLFMDKHIILGVHIHNRGENAVRVQQLLTEYGCNIKTRLGLHEVGDGKCSNGGVLLLELVGDEDRCRGLESILATIGGVEVQKMEFGHD
jgi:hypothetical protein